MHSRTLHVYRLPLLLLFKNTASFAGLKLLHGWSEEQIERLRGQRSIGGAFEFSFLRAPSVHILCIIDIRPAVEDFLIVCVHLNSITANLSWNAGQGGYAVAVPRADLESKRQALAEASESRDPERIKLAEVAFQRAQEVFDAAFAPVHEHRVAAGSRINS
jgi:hypothetical protein